MVNSTELWDLNSAQTGQLNPLLHIFPDLMNRVLWRIQDLGQKPIIWQDFRQNLHEYERNWTGGASLAPSPRSIGCNKLIGWCLISPFPLPLNCFPL